jgi:hypothetical protein
MLLSKSRTSGSCHFTGFSCSTYIIVFNMYNFIKKCMSEEKQRLYFSECRDLTACCVGKSAVSHVCKEAKKQRKRVLRMYFTQKTHKHLKQD